MVHLGAEEAAADRLSYAYATTVHRSQGATTARAHLFADGGGRELAYVAMSRAREATHVWTVADDLGQAREDLVRDWSTEPSAPDAYRNQLDGVARPARTPAAAHAAVILPRPSPAYGPVTEVDLGPSS